MLLLKASLKVEFADFNTKAMTQKSLKLYVKLMGIAAQDNI